jgi:capsular polysaccharide biosynthesis protein
MTALFLSMGIALFLELLNDTVVFNEQVTATTGLPVLAIFER